MERDMLDIHEYLRCAEARMKIEDWKEAQAFFYHAVKTINEVTHFVSDKIAESESDENREALETLNKMLMEKYRNDCGGSK